MIGRGSRYASPARADRPKHQGPAGGAIISSYYNGNKSAVKNHSYVSDPVSAPTNYSQNMSNAGRGQSPGSPKKGLGDIQEFLNRLPAKTTA